MTKARACDLLGEFGARIPSSARKRERGSGSVFETVTGYFGSDLAIPRGQLSLVATG